MLNEGSHMPTSEMLAQYLNTVPGQRAVYKNIPIAERENVLAHFRGKANIRIRYRGSRKNRPGRVKIFGRYTNTSSHCLRSEANRFAVYFDFKR